MSDVTVRWPTAPGGEVRENVFEDVRLEMLLSGPTLIGYLLKGKGWQVTVPFARVEMLTEAFEHDPRDDDKPDKSPQRISVVPK